jgi:uncharacterized protein YjiS (DUF1127 family)
MDAPHGPPGHQTPDFRQGDAEMAITYTPAAAPFGAIAIHRMVGAVSDLFFAIRDWNNARRTVAALSRLSAGQLDDIGLSPADIGRRRF